LTAAISEPIQVNGGAITGVPGREPSITGAQIAEIAVGAVKQQNPEDLRGALLDGLNIRFLVEGLGFRNIKVTTISDDLLVDTTGSQYRQRELLFSDPYVGTFKGILLTPPAPIGSSVTYPIVLALHGHGETAEIYRDTYFATDYPAVLQLS